MLAAPLKSFVEATESHPESDGNPFNYEVNLTDL